jgi:hypothetical protein
LSQNVVRLLIVDAAVAVGDVEIEISVRQVDEIIGGQVSGEIGRVGQAL